MPDSPSNRTARPQRRGAHLLSTILFIAAIAFAAGAVYLYIAEDDTPEGPARPEAEAGRNELAHIVGGLDDAGLDAQYGRYSVESNQLTQPGQTIEVEERSLFVFIYPDANGDAAVAAREADAAGVDPATMTLQSSSAERVIGEGEELHVFEGSNVVAVLVGGDDALVTDVQNVIESLP